MKKAIVIRNVKRDDRIGSAFKELFSIILKTEQTDTKEVTWDFTDTLFLHPFFLAPLALYKESCGKPVSCNNIHPAVNNYLKLIHFDSPLCIDSGSETSVLLDKYLSKTYIPICRFSRCNENIDNMQTVIQNIIQRQSNASSNITTPLSYFLGELICNIGQHSQSEYGYIFSQYLHTEKCIDMCIADSGITVYGSYAYSNKYLDEIGCNEALALKKANDGYSTKNLPDAENRGYGLQTTRKMLVEGMGGSFFMLSGGAFHRHDANGSKFVSLPPDISWRGTVILMRIPVNVDENFNYKDFLE